MTYHTRLAADGTVTLPDQLLRALGFKTGDQLSVDRSGNGIVVRHDDGRSAAIGRLRDTMRGYSVDQFLAERKADWAE